jgi:hypothetical protein
MPPFKIIVREEVEISPRQIARLFCDMDAIGQAEFFSEIASLIKDWPQGLGYQLVPVTECGELTDGGRNVMRVIGEFADNKR